MVVLAHIPAKHLADVGRIDQVVPLGHTPPAPSTPHIVKPSSPHAPAVTSIGGWRLGAAAQGHGPDVWRLPAVWQEMAEPRDTALGMGHVLEMRVGCVGSGGWG